MKEGELKMKQKTSQSYLLCKEKYAKIEESRNGKNQNATTKKTFSAINIQNRK